MTRQWGARHCIPRLLGYARLVSTVIPFYSRSSLHVDIYDRLHASQEDVEFYLRCARDVGHRVLELGVGTGRVAIPLATAGLDVTGVDRSEPMLSLAKRKARIELCGFEPLAEYSDYGGPLRLTDANKSG